MIRNTRLKFKMVILCGELIRKRKKKRKRSKSRNRRRKILRFRISLMRKKCWKSPFFPKIRIRTKRKRKTISMLSNKLMLNSKGDKLLSLLAISEAENQVSSMLFSIKWLLIPLLLHPLKYLVQSHSVLRNHGSCQEPSKIISYSVNHMTRRNSKQQSIMHVWRMISKFWAKELRHRSGKRVLIYQVVKKQEWV